MIQSTLILVKPDGLRRSLTGNILTRLSETKLKIVGAKIVRVSGELAEEHYSHLKDEPFYPELIRYITGQLHGDNRVLALVYWGEGAIKSVREIAGATNPEEAEPTTIRAQFGRIRKSGLYENVIHASGDEKEAEREIKLWFSPEEIAVELYPAEEVIEEKSLKKVWK